MINDSIIKDIQKYFNTMGYGITDITNCIQYLERNDFLHTFQEVLECNIEAYEIKCPITFLKTDFIVNNDNDYIMVGNKVRCKYLNIHLIEECGGLEQLLKDNIIYRNEEEIFYLFTQAMELKWQDTVEAIHDLTKFCIATENYDIWEEIFNFTKEKAQQIIDKENKYDKEDCISAFKNDEWLHQYIAKIKGEKQC